MTKTTETLMRRYTFKMYPNKAQEAVLFELRYLVCQLYNGMVEQRRDAWDRCKKSISKFDQNRECTLLRHDDERYKRMGSAIMERCTERVDQAFKKYFDNVKLWRKGLWSKPYPPSPPRYQKTVEFSGFGYRANATGGWLFMGDRVRMKGIEGLVRLSGRFPVKPDDIKTCDVMYRGGNWMLSIVVKVAKNAAMQAATEQFSNAILSNLPIISDIKTDICCGIPEIKGEAQDREKNEYRACGCGIPEIKGEAQVTEGTLAKWRRCGIPEIESKAQAQATSPFAWLCCGNPEIEAKINLNMMSYFGDVTDCCGTRCLPIEPAKAAKGPRGAKNKARRRAKSAARQEHVMHEITTALAMRYKAITLVRPPLKSATKSAAGTAFEHGAQVAWKAGVNRDALDWGAGKFCAMLTYKMADRGGKLKIIETEDHALMIANAIVQTAKIAKNAKRSVKKLNKNGAIRVPTKQKLSALKSNYHENTIG